MSPLLIAGIRVALLAVMFSVPLAPTGLPGQERGDRASEAYFRAVAEHFRVSPAEMAILRDWELEPDEVPVVLFLSEQAGVSTDVLIGLRRGGRSWQEVAKRFGMGVHSFHIPLPTGEPLGHLSRAYGEFRGRSAADWHQITLDDPEIVSLVNLRVLSEQVAVPPLRVLRSRERAGSFVAGFADLLGAERSD